VVNHPNRNQRRRAAKLAVVEEVELATLRGTMCAWNGCGETFADDMPPGWVWLLAYWAKRPSVDLADPEAKWMRDAALCPAHARDLDLQLKEIPGSALFGPPHGEA
jgi:hypothetical protein